MRFPFVLLRGLFLLSFVLSFLTGPIGCGTLKHPGFPKQSYNEDDELEKLQKLLNTTTMIKVYYGGNSPGALEGKEDTSKTQAVDPAGATTEGGSPEKTSRSESPRRTKVKRNEIITARLLLIDKFYNRFIGDFSKEKQGLDTLVDVATIGVDLAVATVGGASAKAALGAASAGLTGSKLSFDKNFYFEKTISVLITSMNAARKKALFPIKKGSKRSLEEYSLGDALQDLNSYYLAGTFVGALQAMQVDAGAKEKAADIKIAKFRDESFFKKEKQERVEAILPSIDTLKPGVALDLLTNPPVKDDDGMKLVNLRDTGNRRNKSDAVAKRLLKMYIIYTGRSEEEISAWESAITAGQ